MSPLLVEVKAPPGMRAGRRAGGISPGLDDDAVLHDVRRSRVVLRLAHVVGQGAILHGLDDLPDVPGGATALRPVRELAIADGELARLAVDPALALGLTV